VLYVCMFLSIYVGCSYGVILILQKLKRNMVDVVTIVVVMAYNVEVQNVVILR
jgi:hypothetical protein